jgi:DNA-binding transcriptional LysR family regulator
MDLLARMATYVRVVEAGSLSAAAKQLRISTAAVSRHIAMLEAETGTSLIARTTRRMTVTAAGQRYHERCLRVLRDVDDAQSVGRAGLDGPVRMSVPVTVGFLAGAQLLRPLMNKHPDLRIDVRLDDRIVDLALDDVDIAIRIAQSPPLSTEIVAVELSRWSRIIVASPAYVRRHGEPKTPSALATHDALASTREAASEAWTLVDGAGTARFKVKTRCSSNAGHLLRDLALEGLGIALLPPWFVEADLREKRLLRVLPTWTSTPTTTLALYRASLRSEPRVRLLVEQLRSAYPEMERSA